ncbi:hypothetical protein M0R04_05545 [Candidatus Dojkabacteria bacterium]|jgi:hypothetical protein|nr:hypothetical protein [Candidatus Dojkabacteria bacterium]
MLTFEQKQKMFIDWFKFFYRNRSSFICSSHSYDSVRTVKDCIINNIGNYYPTFSGEKPSSTISYYPYERRKAEHKEGDESNPKFRIETTMGRFLSRQFKLADWICGLFAAVADTNMENADQNISIVSGKAIIQAYKQGFGKKTCMTGASARHTKLYAINPDKVGLLLYDGESKARALVWKTDEGKIFLDKIYCGAANQRAIRFLIKQFAFNRGWYVDGVHTITLKCKGIRNFPYIDTFRWGKYDGDSLTLGNTHINGYNVDLSHTEGGEVYWRFCSVCKGSRFLNVVYVTLPRHKLGTEVSMCQGCIQKYGKATDEKQSEIRKMIYSRHYTPVKVPNSNDNWKEVLCMNAEKIKKVIK